MLSLFLIRTPLQAWIAESVREFESCASFCVIYVTVNDACEDRISYKRFSKNAHSAWYVTIAPKRPDFLHQVDLARKLEAIRRSAGHCWDKVLLASFDAHGINALTCRARPAEVVGFDDGTANINLTGKYAPDSMSIREHAYRHLLGGVSNREFINKISRHYTIFGDMPNVVSSDRLIPLDPLLNTSTDRNSGIVTYFLGQPLEQVLNRYQIRRLLEKLNSEAIEWYVKHPRELEPLNLGSDVSFLEKNGEIAERAIQKHADGREIWLYGWFSTVMFTMRSVAIKRIMYLPYDDPRSIEFARIAKKAGCEIIDF